MLCLRQSIQTQMRHRILEAIALVLEEELAEALFRRSSERDVFREHCAILFLDGFQLKIRMARRMVSVPVLSVLGVAQDGRKHLVALQPAARGIGIID